MVCQYSNPSLPVYFSAEGAVRVLFALPGSIDLSTAESPVAHASAAPKLRFPF